MTSPRWEAVDYFTPSELPSLPLSRSLLWDITRAFQLSEVHLSTWWQQASLPQNFLDSWAANTTALVRYIQGLFPVR